MKSTSLLAQSFVVVFFFPLEHQLQEKKNFHEKGKYLRQPIKIVVLSGTGGSHHQHCARCFLSAGHRSNEWQRN